jgi:hypothetical protein
MRENAGVVAAGVSQVWDNGTDPRFQAPQQLRRDVGRGMVEARLLEVRDFLAMRDWKCCRRLTHSGLPWLAGDLFSARLELEPVVLSSGLTVEERR